MTKTQERALCRKSHVMKTHIKLVAHKTWNFVILEYLLKYKTLEEVVSEMDIVTSFSTQYILRHNECQIRFLDKLVLKQDV